MQLYFDFAGCSDMAIGLALADGISVSRKNFNLHYISRSITEFWHMLRWHISLSVWLRDYLYIPLGGQSEGNHTDLRQSCVGDAARRPVARRQLDVCFMGRLAWHPFSGAGAAQPTGRNSRRDRRSRCRSHFSSSLSAGSCSARPISGRRCGCTAACWASTASPSPPRRRGRSPTRPSQRWCLRS